MADKNNPTPAPSNSPAVGIDLTKLKTDTEGALKDLQKELGFDESKKDWEHKEMEEIVKFIKENKDKITRITRVELDQLKADLIDSDSVLGWKLNIKDDQVETQETQAAITTPPETPKEENKAEGPEEKAIQQAKNFFALEETDEIKVASKAPFTLGSWLGKMIQGFILKMKEAFGLDVSEDKAKMEGYSNYDMQQKCAIVLGALSPYMGKGIEALYGPKEGSKKNEESLVRLIEWAWIPTKYARSSLKYIFTGDNTTLDKLPSSIKTETLQAIRGKYLLADEDGSLKEKTSREKLEDIFTIEPEEVGTYIQRAEDEEDANKHYTAILGPLEGPKEAEKPGKEELSVDQIIAKYDGKPYEENKENTTNKTIFVIKKTNDKEMTIKRWTQEEKIAINPDGTMTYRGIEGKTESIVQLARLDMYAQSLDGSLLLADKNNLTTNKITKFEPQMGENFSLWEIPEFTPNWNWQQLYLFLSHNEDKKISPAEAAQMSWKKENPKITQVDIDVLMGRTEKSNAETSDIGPINSAKFSWKVESDSSITIRRTTLDGDKNFDESIFPNPDGTFMVGNVDFPTITDAVKAANMRNWVRWHEQNGHDLYNDGSTFEVRNWSWWNPLTWGQADLMSKDSIPEFLSHGTLQDGQELTGIETIFEFLKQATVDNGTYGKNKSREMWEKSKKNPPVEANK